eukprot:jgi/Undpi1/8969/HiC_scaffold_26.g11430.m1
MSNGESRQDGFEERREGFGSSAPRQPQLRLPFFKPWVPRPAAGAADAPPSPPVALESCGVKLIMGTIGGAGMGFVFGLFLGAMGDMQPLQMVNGRQVPQAPFKEQARVAYKQTAERSISLGKNFASFSAIFMGSECVIEKMRGKTDMMNSVYAGCATGAAFGIRQGPQAACFGCVGMATFSAIMDKVMGH